jgi:hypothetical protein
MSSLFPAAVYLLCFATSVVCAWLLARSFHRTGLRVLMWSALCFSFLAFNNLVVIVDMLVLPDGDLSLIRSGFSLAGVGTLLFGFIWDLDW